MELVKDNDLLFYRDGNRLRRLNKMMVFLVALGCLVVGVLLYFGFATMPGGSLSDHPAAEHSQTFRTAAVLFAILYCGALAAVIHPARAGQTLTERLFGMSYPKLLLKAGERVLPCQVRLILWNNHVERDHSRMEHLRYGAVAPQAVPLTLQFLSVIPEAVAVTAYRLGDEPFAGGETLLEQGQKIYADHGTSCALANEGNLLCITPPAKSAERYFYRVLCSFGTNFHANLMEIGFVLTFK